MFMGKYYVFTFITFEIQPQRESLTLDNFGKIFYN